MFGFLKKKFCKPGDEPRPAEQPDGAQDVPVADVADAAAGPGAEQRTAAASPVDEAPGAAGPGPVEAPVAPAAAEPAVPVVESEPAPEPGPEAAPQAEPEAEPPAAPALTEPEVAPAPAAKKSWTERLKAGLARTRQQLGGGLASLFGLRKIDEDLLEELESTLLMADCGVDATQHLIDDLRRRWKRDRLETADQLQKIGRASCRERVSDTV